MVRPRFIKTCLPLTLIISLGAFKDIRSAIKRSDGLWNIICMDFSVEVGVTYDDIVKDAVCNR